MVSLCAVVVCSWSAALLLWHALGKSVFDAFSFTYGELRVHADCRVMVIPMLRHSILCWPVDAKYAKNVLLATVTGHRASC